jgi:Flp pilus assembly pilin Flp
MGIGGVYLQKSRRWLGSFLSSESGATAIEYGLIFIGISVAMFAAVDAVGNAMKTDMATAAVAVNP